MNPKTIQVQVTRYVCSRCQKEHDNAPHAESCCMCETCGKNVVPPQAKRWDATHYECEACARKRAKKSAKAAIVRAQERIREHEQRIAWERDEIAKLELLFAPTPKEGA